MADGVDVTVRSATFNSDGELTGLAVETPEESVELVPRLLAADALSRIYEVVHSDGWTNSEARHEIQTILRAMGDG